MNNQPSPIESEATVRLVSGAVWNFVNHLASRGQPLIVGAAYSRERLEAEFQNWAAEHKLRLDNVDVKLWLNLSDTGALDYAT
jgi:hypothetical protein